MPPAGLPESLNALLDSFQEKMDASISRPPAGSAFTPLKHTTSVLEATIDAPRFRHKDIMPVLMRIGEPSGVVIAINSNYGGVVQPNYEEHLKTGAKPKKNAPAGRKQRQPEGQGGCFSSALEPILRPPPDSEICQKLEANDLVGIIYKLKYFPTTGSFQVAGCRLNDLTDGYWATEEFTKYLNRINILGGPASVREGSYHLAKRNFKFVLNKRAERQMINFDELYRIILDEKGWPVPIIEATVKITGRETSFLFHYECEPDLNGKPRVKMPRVNFYHASGRINFLGFPSFEFAQQVYNILDRMFLNNWDAIVQLTPLRDNAPIVRRDEIDSYIEQVRERQHVRPPELPVWTAAAEEALQQIRARLRRSDTTLSRTETPP